MDQMMAPGFISHPLFEEPDHEGYKRQVASYVAAFSNVSILIEDQMAAGDKPHHGSGHPRSEGTPWRRSNR